jgi:DNA-binding CsgD family transcriptional regulator
MTDYSEYDDDYLFDTNGAGGLGAVAERLPHVTTRHETIVVDGKPKFKAPVKIRCPRCQQELHPGIATIEFRHAPEDRRQQSVDAWVCECGESYVPGEVAKKAFRAAMTESGEADEKVLLTQRETQIVRLICDGMSNKQISVELEIGYESVTEQVQHILRKMGVSDRTKANAWAKQKEKG